MQAIYQTMTIHSMRKWNKIDYENKLACKILKLTDILFFIYFIEV